MDRLETGGGEVIVNQMEDFKEKEKESEREYAVVMARESKVS
jgi:hypothetical protein